MADGKSTLTARIKETRNKLRRLINSFYSLTAGDVYDIVEIIRNYEEISKVLKGVAERKNVMLFYEAERFILEAEMIELGIFVSQCTMGEKPISREIRTDLTSLQNGIAELSRALSALELREHDPALYHEISDASRPLGELDSHGVSKDVVRKCARSQAKRLQDQARGKSKSALDRKEQSVLATRRNNMEACEKIYLVQQREFARERAESSR